MRGLVPLLLDNRQSRRGFIKNMAAAGLSATEIDTIIDDLEAAELPVDGGGADSTWHQRFSLADNGSRKV